MSSAAKPRAHRALPAYTTVVVTVLAALILADLCAGGSHPGHFTAFAWCFAGLATAFGLDVAMDAGSRSRVEKG